MPETLDSAAAPLEHVATIGSTNEELLARARAGIKGPLWLRADRQITGRGRLGRSWTSPVGNLYLSLLLTDPAAEPQYLPQLAHVAGVALAETVAAVTGNPDLCRLKWPNDLLYGPAKVAGILVEGTRHPDGRSACVIGWGVNCIHHPDGLPYEATNLAMVCGRSVEAGALAVALRGTMHDALAAWNGGRGYATTRCVWLRYGFPLGTSVSVSAPQGRTTGLFAGLDQSGRLLLQTTHGITAVEAGDIELKSETAAPVG